MSRCRRGLRRDLSGSALPRSRNPFHAGLVFRGFTGSRLLRPVRLLAPLDGSDRVSPATGGFYIQASNAIGTLLDMTTAVTGLLCWRDFHPQEWQLASLHWSGRALQEDFVELAAAVLHQCIRPLIGACGAPGHHGYQRACVLISGQASIGPFGSPVFARVRKTEPPSRLIFSQTSAGNC